MIITVQRYSQNAESTLGLLFLDDMFECYTLEDKFTAKKLPGSTRIPAGIYEVKFRKQDSPLTQRYKSKFRWFDWHLELQDVPNFKNVYIHIGNDDEDTDGCILVGNTANNNKLVKGFIGESTYAFNKMYGKVAHALDHERVFIHIIDEK